MGAHITLVLVLGLALLAYAIHRRRRTAPGKFGPDIWPYFVGAAVALLSALGQYLH